MARWRVEYPGGPAYSTRVVDMATGAVVPGIRAIRWVVEGAMHGAVPPFIIETTSGRIIAAPGPFECVVEMEPNGGHDGADVPLPPE